MLDFSVSGTTAGKSGGHCLRFAFDFHAMIYVTPELITVAILLGAEQWTT